MGLRADNRHVDRTCRSGRGVEKISSHRYLLFAGTTRCHRNTARSSWGNPWWAVCGISTRATAAISVDPPETRVRPEHDTFGVWRPDCVSVPGPGGSSRQPRQELVSTYFDDAGGLPPLTPRCGRTGLEKPWKDKRAAVSLRVCSSPHAQTPTRARMTHKAASYVQREIPDENRERSAARLMGSQPDLIHDRL